MALPDCNSKLSIYATEPSGSVESPKILDLFEFLTLFAKNRGIAFASGAFLSPPDMLSVGATARQGLVRVQYI
jgi:hypothetical protein